MFPEVPEGPALFLVDPRGSRGSWNTLQHPGWLWRVLEWSGHNWMFLEMVWTDLVVLVHPLRQACAG